MSQLIWRSWGAMNMQTNSEIARQGQRSGTHYTLEQTCMQREREQKARRWNKMWCFIMEMTLCGVLCWIITSRCLGSQGLADIKACRVLGRQWRGGEELGSTPVGWGWWHQGWGAASISHSVTPLHIALVCKHVCVWYVSNNVTFFLWQILSDQVWIIHIFH